MVVRRHGSSLFLERPFASLVAASLVVLLVACDTDDGEIARRDPAPEIEAAADRASAEASDAWKALQANWEASVSDVKARFDELDETTIIGTGGDRGALVALIVDAYKVDPAEAERRVTEWEASR